MCNCEQNRKIYFNLDVIIYILIRNIFLLIYEISFFLFSLLLSLLCYLMMANQIGRNES
jgi:hypothetical protein